jgi:5-methylcytosine-specific restriction endonuclease McrA
VTKLTRKEKETIRRLVYEEANESCERCGIGLIFEAGSWSSMHLSHKRSRGAGGDWSRENLECLCIQCHLVGVHSPKCVPAKA